MRCIVDCDRMLVKPRKARWLGFGIAPFVFAIMCAGANDVELCSDTTQWYTSGTTSCRGAGSAAMNGRRSQWSTQDPTRLGAISGGPFGQTYRFDTAQGQDGTVIATAVMPGGMTASIASISSIDVDGAFSLSTFSSPLAKEMADGSFQHSALLSYQSGNQYATGLLMLSCYWDSGKAGGLPSTCLLGKQLIQQPSSGGYTRIVEADMWPVEAASHCQKDGRVEDEDEQADCQAPLAGSQQAVRAYIAARPNYNDMVYLYEANLAGNGSMSLKRISGISTHQQFVVGVEWTRRQSDGPGIEPELLMLTSTQRSQGTGFILTLGPSVATTGATIDTKGWVRGVDTDPIIVRAARPMEPSNTYWLLLLATGVPLHDDDNEAPLTSTGFAILQVSPSGQSVQLVFASKASDPDSWFQHHEARPYLAAGLPGPGNTQSQDGPTAGPEPGQWYAFFQMESSALAWVKLEVGSAGSVQSVQSGLNDVPYYGGGKKACTAQPGLSASEPMTVLCMDTANITVISLRPDPLHGGGLHLDTVRMYPHGLGYGPREIFATDAAAYAGSSVAFNTPAKHFGFKFDDVPPSPPPPMPTPSQSPAAPSPTEQPSPHPSGATSPTPGTTASPSSSASPAHSGTQAEARSSAWTCSWIVLRAIGAWAILASVA